LKVILYNAALFRTSASPLSSRADSALALLGVQLVTMAKPLRGSSPEPAAETALFRLSRLASRSGRGAGRPSGIVVTERNGLLAGWVSRGLV
jgi:hypothetical protein